MLQTFCQALKCKCPKCGRGDLYPSTFDLSLNQTCASCNLSLSDNDSADGPAVFLIFLLGALLVPLALWVDHLFSPPLWVHGVLWGSITILLIFVLLKPLKSYVLALQFKTRPETWTQSKSKSENNDN